MLDVGAVKFSTALALVSIDLFNFGGLVRSPTWLDERVAEQLVGTKLWNRIPL